MSFVVHKHQQRYSEYKWPTSSYLAEFFPIKTDQEVSANQNVQETERNLNNYS